MERNIYEKYGGLADVGEAQQKFSDFVSHASEIRKNLGDKCYLLESYLNGLVNAISESENCGEGFYMGFENAFANYRWLAREVKNNINPDVDRDNMELKNRIVKFANIHSAIPKSLLISSVVVMGFENDLKIIIHEYEKYCKLRFEKALLKNKIEDKRQRLISVLTEETVEKLDAKIFGCFINISPIKIFLQGTINHLADSLLEKDILEKRSILDRIIE